MARNIRKLPLSAQHAQNEPLPPPGSPGGRQLPNRFRAGRDQPGQREGLVSKHDVFVHISAVEKAGLSTLNEGAKVSYEEISNRGKTSAENLRSWVKNQLRPNMKKKRPQGCVLGP